VEYPVGRDGISATLFCPKPLSEESPKSSSPARFVKKKPNDVMTKDDRSTNPMGAADGWEPAHTNPMGKLFFGQLSPTATHEEG
jgi:hypothetical protein